MTGADVIEFLVITVFLGGLAAWATGRAVALSWAPLWHLVVYVLLLAVAVRLLHLGLVGASLAAIGAIMLDIAVLAAIAFATHRMTRATQMTTQYPWLYETAGVFSWRPRHSHATDNPAHKGQSS